MTNEELSAKVAEARGEKILSKGGGLPQYKLGDYKAGWSPKPYATDLNCAWELVKEIGLTLFEVHNDSGSWFVRSGRLSGSNQSSTMPRAICKAYLKWRASNE